MMLSVFRDLFLVKKLNLRFDTFASIINSVSLYAELLD